MRMHAGLAAFVLTTRRAVSWVSFSVIACTPNRSRQKAKMHLVVKVLLEKVNSPICKPTPSGAAARPRGWWRQRR
ncbi:hypothetical protein K456DRAFT_50491 [Colletotrichum gloeosporioides 23]|nr:hypothetical protein K456DRAFT_50491 [Colletotrichum gloeosporioides 23]